MFVHHKNYSLIQTWTQNIFFLNRRCNQRQEILQPEADSQETSRRRKVETKRPRTSLIQSGFYENYTRVLVVLILSFLCVRSFPGCVVHARSPVVERRCNHTKPIFSSMPRPLPALCIRRCSILNESLGKKLGFYSAALVTAMSLFGNSSFWYSLSFWSTAVIRFNSRTSPCI